MCSQPVYRSMFQKHRNTTARHFKIVHHVLVGCRGCCSVKWQHGDPRVYRTIICLALQVAPAQVMMQPDGRDVQISQHNTKLDSRWTRPRKPRSSVWLASSKICRPSAKETMQHQIWQQQTKGCNISCATPAQNSKNNRSFWHHLAQYFLYPKSHKTFLDILIQDFFRLWK